MGLSNILYVDDELENGNALLNVASKIITNPIKIDFFSDPEYITKPLESYDCIITDMHMKHSESGFELVEKSLREGRLPYVVMGGLIENKRLSNQVTLFDSKDINSFDKMTRSEETFWSGALEYIQNHENKTRETIRSAKSSWGFIPEHHIKILMDFYKKNYYRV